MRARSVALVNTLKKTGDGSSSASRAIRLPYAERRKRLVEQAADFFAEYGLTAQTRALAAACGVSQRLLYRFFPTKAALLEEVYQAAILGPYKAVWFEQLRDRTRPVEVRLEEFYRDYCDAVLTRRWLRLFMYASLAETRMAPDYIAAIITRLMETIVEETAAEQDVAIPEDKALVHEIGWVLHGAISHGAIRKHLYGASQAVAQEQIIRLQVRSFLAGFAETARAARESKADGGG